MKPKFITQNLHRPSSGLFSKRASVVAALFAVSLVGAALSSPAYAGRDPVYDQAKASGQIGEQNDGYLGIVGASSPQLVDLVNSKNNSRRTVYTQEASKAGSTVTEFAFTTACRLILNTQPGEMYQLPNGQWAQRGSGPPTRHANCPSG